MLLVSPSPFSALRNMYILLVHLGETCVSTFSARWDMCLSLVRHMSHLFQFLAQTLDPHHTRDLILSQFSVDCCQYAFAFSAPQTPSWEKFCIPKKVSLIFFFPNDMPDFCWNVDGILPSLELHSLRARVPRNHSNPIESTGQRSLQESDLVHVYR